VNCERARAAISERMDGEHLAARVGQPLDAHLETCADCRTFASSASRLRTAVRIREAERIPDLVAPIMATIERERIRPKRRTIAAVSRPPLSRRFAAPVAAALVVGLVAGSLAVGGPWQRDSTRPLAVADVIRGVQAAADGLTSYHATFAITEHGLAADVPVRSLSPRRGRRRTCARSSTGRPRTDRDRRGVRRTSEPRAVRRRARSSISGSPSRTVLRCPPTLSFRSTPSRRREG
jgi:hypothetical protein